jgi:hypothetical protein
MKDFFIFKSNIIGVITGALITSLIWYSQKGCGSIEEKLKDIIISPGQVTSILDPTVADKYMKAYQGLADKDKPFGAGKTHLYIDPVGFKDLADDVKFNGFRKKLIYIKTLLHKKKIIWIK